MTIKDNKIRACPFCEAAANEHFDGDSCRWISCSNGACYVQPETRPFRERGEAIAAWNTRAQPSLQDTVGEDAVERVARAICKARGFDPDRCLHGYSWDAGELGRDMAGSICWLHAWEEHLAEAQAAIAALQPPLVQEAGELVTSEREELETLRKWRDAPEGLKWHIQQTKKLADRIQALEAERDALIHDMERAVDGRNAEANARIALEASLIERCAEIAESHAYCGCNGKHGTCLADDAPKAIAAEIRATLKGETPGV